MRAGRVATDGTSSPLYLKPKTPSKSILLQHGYPSSLAKGLRFTTALPPSFSILFISSLHHSSILSPRYRHHHHHHQPDSHQSPSARAGIGDQPPQTRSHTSNPYISPPSPSISPISPISTSNPAQTGGNSPPFGTVVAGVSPPLACCPCALDLLSVRPKLIVLPALSQFLRFPSPMLL